MNLLWVRYAVMMFLLGSLISISVSSADAAGLHTPLKPCELTSADFENVKKHLNNQIRAGDPVDRLVNLFKWDPLRHYAEKFQREAWRQTLLSRAEFERISKPGEVYQSSFMSNIIYYRQFCQREPRNEDIWILAIKTDEEGRIYKFDIRLIYNDFNFAARNERMSAERYLPGVGRHLHNGHYRTAPAMAVFSLMEKHGYSASQVFEILGEAGYLRAEEKLESREPGGPKFRLFPHNADNAIWRNVFLTHAVQGENGGFGWFMPTRDWPRADLYGTYRISVRYNRLTDEILDIF